MDILFGSGFSEFPGFNGPTLELEVVGIVRSAADLQGDLRSEGGARGYASPRFILAHPDVGGFPPVAHVRLAHGVADVEALREAVREMVGARGEAFVVSADAAYGSSVDGAINVLTTALAAAAIVAALAGVVALVQAGTRQINVSRGSAEVLAGLGMSRRARAIAVALPSVVAIGAGATVAVAGAVLASPLLPIGLARRAEPDPGISIDAVVLAAGWVVALVLGAALAIIAAARLRRASETEKRASAAAVTAAPRRGTCSGVAIVSTGLAVGIPLGVVAGRVAWRAVVSDLGLIDPPTQPWAVIAIAAPAAVLLALLLAWQPGRVAARVDAPNALRAE
jgi:hypothetical protein